MIPFLIALGAVILLLLLFLLLISPRRGARARAKSLVSKKLYAHRGFFDNESIPENSLPAFRNAAEHGYGVELDTRLTSDGEVVVFHDETLERMCGEKIKVCDVTYDELKSRRLLGTDERVPLFSEVLSVIAGRVPVIVEVKGETVGDTEVCRKTAEILDLYGGEYCVESFNPFYMRWFSKNRPGVVRGQLSCKMRDGHSFKRKLRDFLLENLLLNFLSRPDFIAYDCDSKKKPLLALMRFLGAVTVAWTVSSGKTSGENTLGYDAYIFENREKASSV